MLLLLADIVAEPTSGQLAISYGWLLIKMIVVLVIVCTLAMLILKYLVPKLGVLRRHHASGESITVLARHALDAKRHLWIVNVGARKFFLGSGEGAVTCLAELHADDLGEEHRETNRST